MRMDERLKAIERLSSFLTQEIKILNDGIEDTNRKNEEMLKQNMKFAQKKFKKQYI